MFIDCHCHLDHFSEKKIKKIIGNARSAGVSAILSAGTNVASNRKVLGLVKEYSEVLACLGVYPLDALKMSDDKLDKEIDFIRENRGDMVGIGEVGMDFKETDERDRQEKNFRKFISLAMELDKPVIVHSRKAERECIEVLESMGATRVVMHCFSGKLSLVTRILDNGWYLTIPANVTRSRHFQEIVGMAPLSQLLCETDSPYLHPLGADGGENEPANVVESYKKIAEIKGIGIKECEKEIDKNYTKLFS